MSLGIELLLGRRLALEPLCRERLPHLRLDLFKRAHPMRLAVSEAQSHRLLLLLMAWGRSRHGHIVIEGREFRGSRGRCAVLIDMSGGLRAVRLGQQRERRLVFPERFVVSSRAS